MSDSQREPFFDSIFKLLAGIAFVCWMIQEWILPNNKIFLFIAIACGLADLFYLFAHKILPHSRFLIVLSWAMYFLCVWLVYRNPGEANPVKNQNTNTLLAVEANTVGWLPPELPSGCSNISVSFGTAKLDFPVWLAEIQHDQSKTNESGTNFFIEKITSNLTFKVYYAEDETNEFGTKFLIKDLPNSFAVDGEKLLGLSPRKRHFMMDWQYFKMNIDGKRIDDPVWPFVISNRLFVDVEIPFINERHRILMNDELDSELSKLPQLWDINYNSNKFEVVNEATNPVLQVIYKSPAEVRVNGIFIVDKYKAYAAFDTVPVLLAVTAMVVDQQSTQQMEIEDLEKRYTNTLINIDTNFFYRSRFPNQKAIFKYPSWKYLGILNN